MSSSLSSRTGELVVSSSSSSGTIVIHCPRPCPRPHSSKGARPRPQGLMGCPRPKPDIDDKNYINIIQSCPHVQQVDTSHFGNMAILNILAVGFWKITAF